ncbi:MAG: transglutaminase domain-containing protein, partial [Chloroflexota bacterium]|nr:transglutaminase domain-containing protein [Chloroflexota bacterium]
SGTVGFSLSLDVASDLKSQSTAPVLQYQTADTSPPPLRVAVSSFYESDRGVWTPQSSATLSDNPPVPPPTGLSADIPRKRYSMTFEHNLLEEPHLAAPYPLISADLDGIAWGLDDQTQDVRVAERPDAYTVSYWSVEATPKMLQTASTNGSVDGGSFGNDLILDEPSATTINALAGRLTADRATPYDKAMAIQQYLRDTGGFTYSLTLAPPAKDPSGKDRLLDPLTNFLVTKQGYCVQFATAMVMLSRAAGIPARMASGFLRGTFSDGVWSVTQSDAHAWPELYLNDVGWMRFEPTTSRGAPPVYAIPPATPGRTPAVDRPTNEATATAGRNGERPDRPDPSAGSGTTAEVGPSLASVHRWLTHGWGLVLLGSLTGLFGSLVVPTAARWRRRRELIGARTSAQRVEAHWRLLTSSLADLGIPPAPSRTPRQLRAYYDHEALLQGAGSEALGRVVQTLERSRYAASAQVPDGLAADTRQVLRAAAANRRRRDRLRASLWPSGGLAQLRSARADLAWSVRAPLRDVSAVVRQRFPRRR